MANPLTPEQKAKRKESWLKWRASEKGKAWAAKRRKPTVVEITVRGGPFRTEPEVPGEPAKTDA